MKEIADGLYEFEYDTKMMGGLVVFIARTWVVRLPEGCMLISPGPIDDTRAAQIADIGEVRYLIAPNMFHHVFLAKAQNRYPNAKTFLAPGLSKKRPDLAVDGVLGSDELAADRAPWRAVLEHMVVGGCPKLGETVFLHRSSQTLMVTDLFFNIHKTKGPMTKMMLKMMGAFGRPTSSKFARSMFKSRQQAVDSLQKIDAWPFTSISVNHGRAIDSDARSGWQEATAWLRQG